MALPSQGSSGQKIGDAVFDRRGDGGVVSETVQQLKSWLAPEPGHLPFRIAACIAASIVNRVFQREFAPHHLQSLLIAYRLEGLDCTVDPPCKNGFYLFQETVFEHDFEPLLQPPIQLLAVREQADLEYPEALQ